MSDAFINYSREDGDVAERIAATLKSRGLTVWHDRDIEPGTNFLEAIESAMREAACVITIWSRRSVASAWVQAEAQWALKNGKLLPVAIEPDVDIPRQFLTVQTQFLSRGEAGDDWLARLADNVRRISHGDRRTATNPAAGPRRTRGITPQEDAPSALPSTRRKAFISYADEDEEIAIELLKLLEASDCRCWISFRDVEAGEDYRGSIVRAMDEITFLVLIYSEHVNRSFDIATELLLARKRSRKRLVLKMDASEPAGPVEYELANVQWIDGTADRRAGFDKIVRRAAVL